MSFLFGFSFLMFLVGLESRLLATVRWTVATGVAFPQKSESNKGSHIGATILHPNTKVLVNQGLFVFLEAKNNRHSPLHLFLNPLDLNLRLQPQVEKN